MLSCGIQRTSRQNIVSIFSLTNGVKALKWRWEKVLSARVSSRTRRQNLQRRLTARVCEAGQSIFFVSLLVHVLHNFQRDVNGFVNRGEYERQQRQKLHQIHGVSPLCLPAPGRFAFRKSSFPRFTGSFRGMSGKWVQEHDHLQCRQHLITAEAASTAYHKIIRFATKTPPASHLCAAPGACFFCGGKLPQCQLAQNTALKFGRHRTGFFQTIYLKFVLIVVLSL